MLLLFCVCVLYFKVLSFVFLFRISRRCIAVCLAKPKCLLVSAGGSQAIASLTFPCQQLLTPQQSVSFHFDICHLLVFLAFSFLSVHFLVFFCQQAPNNSASIEIPFLLLRDILSMKQTCFV